MRTDPDSAIADSAVKDRTSATSSTRFAAASEGSSGEDASISQRLVDDTPGDLAPLAHVVVADDNQAHRNPDVAKGHALSGTPDNSWTPGTVEFEYASVPKTELA
jgi:hypothetical protein